MLKKNSSECSPVTNDSYSLLMDQLGKYAGI